MTNQACKRFWEGTVGIAIRPRQKRNGGCFWTFSFVRAFRRTRNSEWEYAQHYGQEHAKAVGLVMSKAFQFMHQTDPAEFLAAAMGAAEEQPAAETEPDADVSLDSARLPSTTRAAA